MLLLYRLHLWSLQLLLLDLHPGLWRGRPTETPGQGLRPLHLRLPGALEEVRALPNAALPSKLDPGHRSLALVLAQMMARALALALAVLPAPQPLLMVAGLQRQTYAPLQPLLRTPADRDCESLAGCRTLHMHVSNLLQTAAQVSAAAL